MMNSMIKENGVTFKELEKNIFAWVCQIGREWCGIKKVDSLFSRIS
ncbi:hypothetical protein [[Clostridium] scindens]|nr:hypothetical protein [[Clostridium] scindens]